MATVKIKDRAVYKTSEAAKIAGVGDRSIRAAIETGDLPHMKFGRNVVIPKVAFHSWLDACGNPTIEYKAKGR